MDTITKQALERLRDLDTSSGNSQYNDGVLDCERIATYIEKIEREVFGLRQQVANLKEKDATHWYRTSCR